MKEVSQKTVLVIVGPTASGKTALSIQLAKYFNTAVISADSRQFYRNMTVGTAQPSAEEMQGVKHYFIDFLSVQEDFTAGRFAEDALKTIEEIHRSHPLAIVAGGSGLYLNSLFYGIDDIPSDKGIRGKLNAQVETEGLSPLLDKLGQLDPQILHEVDTQNPKRVIRALEACLASGEKYSELRKKTVKELPFKTLWVGIDLPRDVLYNRINLRVDTMMQNGLEEEARALHPYKAYNALQTVGYRELFDYFEGKDSLEETVDKIKQHTRNFAKRQMTWFRKNKDINWLSEPSIDAVLNLMGF